MPNIHSRDATLTMKLVSDTGYESVESTRISPDQWRRINIITNEEVVEPTNSDGGDDQSSSEE